MGTGTYSYDYDPILLRSCETTAGHVGNRNRAVTNTAVTDYESNGLNQYTTITKGAPVSPAYDFDGNMLTNATHAFTWDAENRLLTASNLTKDEVCGFIYDQQSRRISKTVFNSGVSGS